MKLVRADARETTLGHRSRREHRHATARAAGRCDARAPVSALDRFAGGSHDEGERARRVSSVCLLFEEREVHRLCRWLIESLDPHVTDDARRSSTTRRSVQGAVACRSGSVLPIALSEAPAHRSLRAAVGSDRSMLNPRPASSGMCIVVK